jgi:hypothetical protein
MNKQTKKEVFMKFITLVLALITFAANAQTSPRPAGAKICAVAFNSLDRDYTSILNIPENSAIQNLNQVQISTGGDWDNRISKVAVAQGCTFIGYQYQDFNVNSYSGRPLNGFVLFLENNGQRRLKSTVLGHQDNMISSVKCFCNN